MKKFKLLLIGILLTTSFSMFAQQTVKGVVKDKTSGDPLPGVSVVIKGTTKGIQTDFDGIFSINKINKGDILVFRYLGFADKELTIGTNYNLTVVLEESAESLDEIVVVGYGTTTVKDATGSVESITSKDFTKGNIVTPENLLSGRVSGVSVTTSGAPGSGSQITIRGGSSIGASNSPLIIIDGLPIENSDASIAGSRGLLANINPNDIESFSVLKDASATAIYGSRASNGVIIITTKKGRKEFTLDFDMQYTFGEVLDKVNVFSADDYRNLITAKRPGDVAALGSANTNWQDKVLRSTTSSLYNLTAKGQIFGAIPTRLSIGFANQEGALLTSQFDRKTISLSMNPSLFKDHLKINLNYNRVFEDSRFGDSGQIGAALRYDPTQSVYDSSSRFGGYYQHFSNGEIANGTTNPVASLLQRNNTGYAFRQYGNLNFDYKFHFLPELRAVVNVGFDKINSENSDVTSKLAPAQSNALYLGNNAFNTQERGNKLFDTYFNYIKDYNNFNVDLTTGYSYQRFENFGANSGNRNNPENISTTFADPDVVNIGFFGRAKFKFNQKYLLTLNFRRDGTSRFSSDNQWGNFGGAALAWNISDEDFLKDSKVISNLKLRASVGLTGQQNIPGVNDLYLDRYRFGNETSRYLFGNSTIKSTIPSVVNPNLKWEETTTIEFGVDYGLFDNKFSGSVSAFQKTSNDLLFDAALADGTNFGNSTIQNIGQLQIKGLEFTLNGDILKSEDYNWNFTFNATYLDRKITELANNQDVRTGGTSGGTGNTIQLLREGFAPNSFHVYKQLYNTAGKPIEGAYADLNDDGIINDEDRYLKENPNADVTLGFQSSFNYKNFDLGFNLRASLGNYVYNNVNSSRAQYELLQDNAVLGNLPTSVLNTDFLRTSNVINSDIYIENASYLRMDNVTLGYTFNNPIKKFSYSSIRLWAGVQNVFTLTNYSGLDPEVFDGIDNLIYPRSRNFLVGANIKF
ncbi:SusC/RagA family TonB-linked outer membrane protein [Polaribacter sp. Z014]|uniref:SusC/RagA family TonB-linked outer membrane protein n=1 Tax=unclassified Polaribacter TaxID=196858 RepID=UPI00193C5879|nr:MULTISPECIES: SusC/RagA family TonB-linked outer membrane protein [unclassified Polaribacter]MCL7763562.1 SusC/RagA family TonB-linked outer membrane protein [Polaribacter sp. Z014]QVY66666.1 SusC/RagA family TonB-linked outer membrane protein [Polaribacter sp. Q13]